MAVLFFDRRGRCISVETWRRQYRDPKNRWIKATTTPAGHYVETSWVGYHCPAREPDGPCLFIVRVYVADALAEGRTEKETRWFVREADALAFHEMAVGELG